MTLPPIRKASPRLKNRGRNRLLVFSLFAGCVATLAFWSIRSNFVLSIAKLPASLCIPACKSQQSDPSSESGLVNQPTLRELIGNDFEADKVSVLVEKSKYKLTVLYDNQPIRSYPIVLGGSPVGDKRAEGDLKTPEGIYPVRALYPHPKWSKFIWLDYPNEQDWEEHLQAKQSGEIPPDATIGSEVGIHGVPVGTDSAIDRRSNWTWGCVSLKNKDIDEIYTVIKQGTLVEIVP